MCVKFNNNILVSFFIDQEKAFDSVNHEYLFYILKQFGFGPSFIIPRHEVEGGYRNGG